MKLLLCDRVLSFQLAFAASSTSQPFVPYVFNIDRFEMYGKNDKRRAESSKLCAVLATEDCAGGNFVLSIHTRRRPRGCKRRRSRSFVLLEERKNKQGKRISQPVPRMTA